jgi:site-specific DNA-methyltransferase (adenine-specific)
MVLSHGNALSVKLLMANAYMPPSLTDDWATPKDLWQQANGFHDFELDAAASLTNHLCAEWFGLDHPDELRRDGLRGNWIGRTWVNPPYGRGIYDWVKKASEHDELVVMLLPARTDTKWFHEFVYQKADLQFIKGRLKFGASITAAPFPSILVTFNG